ncbi:MAG: hypothetical protein K940chlam9_00596 [Chlamydiae bacterium]|nr:hypothetical protein [Chlamydiota bacterium]
MASLDPLTPLFPNSQWETTHTSFSPSGDSPTKKKVDQVYKSTLFQSPFKRQKTTQYTPPEETVDFSVSLQCTEIFCDSESYSELPRAVAGKVEQIEKAISGKRISPDTFYTLRKEIIRVATSQELNEEMKLVELGCLYFYLVKEEGFRKKESYYAKRFHEIQEEIKRLHVDHERSVMKSQKDQISSGKAAYLMRALARMLITPDGKINQGGVLVVRRLLDSELQKVISGEQKKQIFRVLDSFENNVTFREGFLKSLRIHPDMEEVIRIDLKLEKGAKVLPEHLSWNLLIAFFSVFGQVDEGNCFAVSTATNIQIHHLDVVQELWREVLETGCFQFEGKKIPILPLLETRRTYERDFEEKLSVEQGTNWVGFDVAEQALGERVPLDTGGDMRIGDMMSLSFPSDSSYAKEVALSLKQNLLHQTLLTVLNFVILNQESANSEEKNSHPNKKTWFLQNFHAAIKRNFTQWRVSRQRESDCNESPLFTCLLDEFTDRLWLVDSRSWSHQILGGRVQFQYHSQGVLHQPGKENYSHLYQMRRIFHLTPSGKLIPVERISDLKGVIQEILLGIEGDFLYGHLSSAAKPMLQFLAEGWKNEEIAKVFSALNSSSLKGLTAEYYAKSDSAFLIQDGGKTQSILDWRRLNGKYFEPAKIKSSSDEKEWIVHIGSCIRLFEKKKGFDWEKPLLISSAKHAFNLYPKFLSDFTLSPDELLTTHLVGPGESLLSDPSDRKWQKRVILEAVGGERLHDYFDAELKQEGRTQREFYELARKKLPEEDHAKLAHIFDLSLREISIEDYFDDIESLLRKVEAPIPETGSVFTSVLRSDQEHLLPSEIAQLIKKWLSSNNIFSLSIWEIEDIVCDYYDLPRTLLLGNLNWIPTMMEKHQYSYLTLRYDPALQKCRFFERKGHVEIPLEASLAKSIRENTTLLFSL